MEPVAAWFGDVADGSRPVPEGLELKRLLRFCRGAVMEGETETRLIAIAVLGRVGGDKAVEVLQHYCRAPEPEVRRANLELAIEMGPVAMAVIRGAALDTDADIAVRALGILRQAADKVVAGDVRRQLGNQSAEVRLAAVELLGQVGGKSCLVPVRRLTSDEDERVRTAATLADQRISGTAERDEPEQWWKGQEIVELQADPDRIVPLPAELPTEAAALLSLLGSVAEADRGTVLEALRSTDGLGLAVVAHQAAGGDVAIGRGICHAAVGLERKDWIVPVRRRLQDPDATVRLEVARALAFLGKGKASLVMGLADLLVDDVIEVRVEGARAMAALGLANGIGILERSRKDQPDAALAAIDAAIEALRS